ncbi:MAG TPA: glycosyltransferase [Thermoleophilaceae bacterium]|nr:glycosyltransferase [Thermoleophilaceae bacterium]
MRLALVSEHASPLATLGGVDAGGQNVHVAELARGLGRRGHEVVVHTRRDSAELPAYVRFAPGVTVHHVDAGPPCAVPKDELLPYMGEFADCLTDEWAARRPAIVHAHFWMSGMASLEAAGRLGVPVVQTFHALGVVKRRHQGPADTSPADRLAIERAVVAAADRIVATCTDEVFELLRIGADRRRIAVVPCGVDLDRFRPDGPAHARREGLRRIVTLGRLVERKGVGNVIEALAEVPDAELVVVGGPEAAELEYDGEVRRLRAVARAAGVEHRVAFAGRLGRDEVPALIRSADVVAAVPWYEPFGIVPLEAMACGVPVVASAVGGMIDTVVDGVTGAHVPPRDPAALAATLRDLLDRPELRARLGRAGAARARERYGWDGIAGATQESYRHVLAERRSIAVEGVAT